MIYFYCLRALIIYLLIRNLVTNCASENIWLLSNWFQECRHRQVDENGFTGHGKPVLPKKCDQG